MALAASKEMDLSKLKLFSAPGPQDMPVVTTAKKKSKGYALERLDRETMTIALSLGVLY